MIRISFDIPGPPVAKGRPRIVRIGSASRMATPEKTVAYESLVALAGQQAMAGRPPLEGPISVEIQAYFPIPRSWPKKAQEGALSGSKLPTHRPDADNVSKAILDGLNGIVWVDDAQVVDLTVKKRYSTTPQVSVHLHTIGKETA